MDGVVEIHDIGHRHPYVRSAHYIDCAGACLIVLPVDLAANPAQGLAWKCRYSIDGMPVGKCHTYTLLNQMFFKRAGSSNAVSTKAPSAGEKADAEHLSTVLDALGLILSAYVKGVFDMAGHPEAETRAGLEAWRRHALIGTPPPDDSVMGTPRPGGASIADRDWNGVSGAFADHRRLEKEFVETALGDLRDALWLCVEQAQDALAAEEQAGSASAVHKERLKSALDRLETGIVKDEIVHAMRSLEKIAELRQQSQQRIYVQLAERIAELDNQLQETRRVSETDSLTGLGNRLSFDHAIQRQAHVHAINGNPLTLVLLDMDRLKPINDLHGHQAGDQALMAISRCLHRVFLRESDIICRIGGDEFAVILPNTSHALCEKLVDRLLATVAEEPWPFTDSGLPLSVSVGYALRGQDDTNEAWIARADSLLYAHKAQRREILDARTAGAAPATPARKGSV